MAQLALGIAGAAIGFAIGGPTGAQIGFAAGSFLGSSLGPGTTTQGPRLSDLKVQVSSYGQAIPRGYGGFPVAGNVIWSTDLQEERNSEEVGKGGPSQTNVTYSYSVSCAIALCEGPIAGVRRIWADSKLVYDISAGGDADTVDASQEFAEFFTLYLGTEDQTPDPTMEAALGAGEVPAYLGTAYIVFTDLPLADYGNRIPNFLFEVFTEGDYEPYGIQSDGLLCHFDEIGPDGKVVSAVGPDMSMATGADIVGSPAKFDNAGEVPSSGSYGFGATGVTGTLNRSWRLEMMVYLSTQDQTFFRLEGGSYSITLGGSFFGDAAMLVNYVSGGGAGGGRFGDPDLKPVVGQWNHVGVEYTLGDNQVYAFCNGSRIGGIIFSPGVGNPFAGGEFTTVSAGSSGVAGMGVDELYLHFNTTAYGESYAVPGRFDASDISGEVFIPGQVFLPDVVEAISLECGLESSEIDVSDLPSVEVLGYTRARQMPGRAAIDPLRQVYWFDAVESDGKVKYVERGSSSIVTIDDDELGAIEGENDPQPATEPVRAQEAELPAVVNVAYLDRDTDYENGAQTARRVVTGSVQQQSLELPIVLTHQQAADAASVLLYDAWTARTEVSWTTTKKYAKYEPTDVVTLVDGAITRQVRITDKSEEGPVIKWKGRDDKPAVYDPNATPNEPTGSGATIRITGDTVIELIDSPLFLDANNDAGPYVAGYGTGAGWNGGVLYKSTDAGTSYSSVKTLTAQATIGATITTLGDWTGGYVVDEVNTVDVLLDHGSLASVTRAQLLDGAQVAVIGDEVVCFQRATLIGASQYRLSGLIRGARGTEDKIAGHDVGERFVLVSSANWYRLSDSVASIGTESLYKGVTFGKSIEAAESQAFTNTARSLKPFSVCHIRFTDNGDGTYGVTWERRTRMTGRFLGPLGSFVPLGEAYESYDVRVYDGSDVLQSSQTVSTQSATVTASSGYTVSIYQNSDVIGHGIVASKVIP